MNRRILWIAAAAVGATIVTTTVAASPPDGPALTNVPNANTKSTGYAPPDVLSAQLQQTIVAQGATKVENPSAAISYYGYDNDLLNQTGDPVMVPGGGFASEAHKTEPDKNTYLVFKDGLSGADPSYNYGTHFLFQGHETGAPGYITRINLDADAAHRVIVLATKDSTGANIADIDGSTWDPWAKRLLFTTENSGAPTYAATPGYPSTVTDVSGALGRGGYEGIQNDSAGNIWIVEDSGGSNKPGTVAKRPNSFVYRYVPQTPGDLAHGKLEALQVVNQAGDPITFESQAPLNSPDQVALHTYGLSFKTRWVVVHDTAVQGNSPFSANDAAKAAHATPFKRPENGQFRPGSKFTEFYFDETGDTNATSVENPIGGWGSIFKFARPNVDADTGTLTLFYKANESTAGFDNVTFLSRDAVTFVQDAGDTLHTQSGTLDSGYVFDVGTDYSNPANQPLRWLAEGRDPSATLDSSGGGFGKNEGDNEITGVHVSDGDPSVDGILGAKVPELFSNKKWRWFYTQQHGDNFTWEVTTTG
jgi:secreted PhoX family phosphatase